MPSAGLCIATRQLADLLGGGLSLTRSLEIVTAQTSDRKLRETLSAIRRDVDAGRPLSSALASHNRWFSAVHVGLVRAGESTGELESAFSEISTHLDLDRELAQRAKQALVYPCLVLLLSLAVCAFITIFVVPRFQALFEDLGQPLPLPTRMLIAGSGFVRHEGAIVTAVGVAAFAAAPRTWRSAANRILDRAIRHPFVLRHLAPRFVERWAHLMSSLSRGGFSVSDALKLTRSAMSAHPLARALPALESGVDEGRSLSDALRRAPVFPPMVAELVAAGEESGRLDGALDRIARTLGRESDMSVRMATALLEPALILVMALIVGFVAISMLLPIFDMSANVR